MKQFSDRTYIWRVSISAWFCVSALSAAPLTDGNVVSSGSYWRPEHCVVSDGDDKRLTATYFEFENFEDIDVVLMWIDVPAESIHVAIRTIAPPYPNRMLVDHVANHDIGVFGVLLDLDADSASGTLSDSTVGHFRTFADPAIGVEIGLIATFERLGDDPLCWTHGIWRWPSESIMQDTRLGAAGFGRTYDGALNGPNARWMESSWHFDALTTHGYRAPQVGDLIGVAGVMRTPAPFGAENEEITNGGLLLVGWGPVTKSADRLSTIEMRSNSGHVLIPSGRNIMYDELNRTFVVDDRPTISPLSDPPYGDVSRNGNVSMYDASLVLIAALSGVASDADSVLGDANGDGVIDTDDARLIARRVVEPAYRFPVTSRDHLRPDP